MGIDEMAPRKSYRAANDPNHEEIPIPWKYNRAVMRGEEHFKLGQYQKANKEYDKAIKLMPHESKAYDDRARSYFALGKHQRALEDHDKAVEVAPNDPIVYNNRCNSYNALGQHQRAIEDYDKAIKMGASTAGIRTGVGPTAPRASTSGR